MEQLQDDPRDRLRRRRLLNRCANAALILTLVGVGLTLGGLRLGPSIGFAGFVLFLLIHSFRLRL